MGIIFKNGGEGNGEGGHGDVNTFSKTAVGGACAACAVVESSKLQDFLKRINTLMGEEEIGLGEINVPSQEEINKADENAGEINSNKIANNNIKGNDSSVIKLEFEIPNPDSLSPPNWNYLSNSLLNVICHSYFISKERNSEINWKSPLVSYSSINSRVMLKETPFATGAMRYAFYMRDVDLEQNLVAKLPKLVHHSSYNLQTLSKELEAITICQHLVNEFNERVVNLVTDTRILLNFVNCWIYEITSPIMLNNPLLNTYKFYSVENFINGYYQKYNNNAGWINENMNESALLAQAFSHFSWQITKGFLMIVDLQGVGGVLTDPQIHCMDINNFGKGNLGYVGIMKFFMSHMCNFYCKKLELIHPRNKIKIDKDYQFFIEKFVPPVIDSNIWKLCDLCKMPFQKKAKELYELRKKCWEAFCYDCDVKRKATWVKSTCVCCNTVFTNSAYWFKMKRHSFPDKCMKCRLDIRSKERSEHNDKNVVKYEEEENVLMQC